MTKKECQVIAGGAYCAGYLHGRQSGLNEYEACTYWPIQMHPVVSAYCSTVRLLAWKYAHTIEKAEQMLAGKI